MDILKAELERKKKEKDAIVPKNGTKKYFKRGELEKERERQYLEEQERLDRERQEKLARKLAEVRGDSPLPGSLGRSATPTPSQKSDNEKADSDDEDALAIPESELNRRFRLLQAPIKLFAETLPQRIKRLRRLEATHLDSVQSGQRNDFRAAMSKTEQELALENLKRRPSSDATDNTEDDAFPKKKQRTELPEVDTTAISLSLLQSDPDAVYNLLYIYFKRLIREWELFLAARPEDVKRSVQGRLQSATQGQTTEYMKPFFKLLKKRALEPDVLARICEIADWTQKREYLKANDSYLRLSIGNAPWPIGVTMVGIHERSAREKIFASQVAHVLNDEAQRKWIQSIKRLMTFAQTKWPPDDLAKMIG
ncbi:mRNA splicing protein prp18 [Gaertneriomyces sp. JEL0708]|nr:mRNA splicing protein prp18 [Gaertneriomyces sp. JEL0708]